MKVIKVKNYEEMSLAAANIIREKISLKPNSVIGLATGSSPIGIYDNLIRWYKNGELDFSAVSTVNLDEYVGLDKSSECSYRFFMDQHLFSSINIDKEKIHIPNGVAVDLQEECLKYDNIIKSLNRIDVQLLGIGENGHIGFNEPSEVFVANTHIVNLTDETKNANKRFFETIEQVPQKAITMGVDPILNACLPLLIASGSNKAFAIEQMIKGDITPKCPASILKLNHNTVVVVDDEAGKYI
ncbi:MAG: glucosamine-6-phosphate deaminase [Lachnospiraceae bacterium]|nr:glucosamine-6-phosphate deaminase [Lachnospiraceae bacterium]